MRRAPLLLTLCLTACLPGTAEVTILGDGLGAVVDASATVPDGTTGISDGGQPFAETGQPAADGATLADLPPAAPDSTAGSPQPPFGSSVGMTAANFKDIPDCNGTLYALHPYYNKKRGVLIAMMSPS